MSHVCGRFGLFSLLAGILLATTVPAHAEMTDWAVNEGGRMRIVAMPPDPDGTVRGALQIEPNQGWITYWKEPGESGIPPQLSLNAADGVSLSPMSFPIPKRIDTDSLRDIGYDAPVSFPFRMKVDDPNKAHSVTASAFIGLCRNICIPFQAEFSLGLKPEMGTPVQEAMILNGVTSRLPGKPTDDFGVAQYAMTQGGKVLRLTLKLPTGAQKAPDVIVTGPEGYVFFDEKNVHEEDGHYLVDMPIGKLPNGYDIKGKRWGILIIDRGRAVETSLAFD